MGILFRKHHIRCNLSPYHNLSFLDIYFLNSKNHQIDFAYYKVQNIALQKTNSILRSKIEELEIQIDMHKSSGYQVADSSSNIDLIKKIAKLEGELYQTKLQLEEAKES